MKIDIYTHILPEKYRAALLKKVHNLDGHTETNNPVNTILEIRLRLMNRYPDVIQVLTLSEPPLETLVGKEDAVELAKIANDELAELVVKYPDKFIAAVACLPLCDMDSALLEVDRAITQLGMKGIQINSRIQGDTLDNPKFRPLFVKMQAYDLPIWIHPGLNKNFDTIMFKRPMETAVAMEHIVKAGIFNDFPNIKIITHHCGSMVPMLEGRITSMMPQQLGPASPIHQPVEHFRKFYADSATYGSTPALMCGYAFFGPNRILFGTDAPLGPKKGITGGTIEAVERMSIPETEKQKIFQHNAINLLKVAI